MFWDTIKLVTEVVQRYGGENEIVDINGSESPCLADYEQVIQTKDQESRYLTLTQAPFDHISLNYKIIGSSQLTIVEALESSARLTGPILCLELLESEPDPFAAIKKIAELMDPNAYVIIASSFSYPYQDKARDYWRFTPEGLKQLIKSAGLTFVEGGWRLQIDHSQGILNLSNNQPQEIYSCYAVGALKMLQAQTSKRFPLPFALPLNEKKQIPSYSNIPESEKPRCLFLNTCYEKFIIHHYQQNPALLQADYNTQLSSINKTFFGDSDFYSSGLRNAGFVADDLIINCAPLQQRWAVENSCSEQGTALVLKQIEQFKPDIVYIQDMSGASPEFILSLKHRGIMVIGQIACEVTSPIPFELYDIVFSSFLHFVEKLRAEGVTAYYQPLSFSPEILSAIGNRSYQEKDINCSFIGGLSAYHSNGTKLLEKLAELTPIQVWGYGIDQIPASSPLRQRHQGEAWGHQMFSLLNRSKITVNRHSEAASTNANNMRLFEATGCGALLITDYKDNLNLLFEIGKEVVAYRTPDECAALIKYYTANPLEAQKIAQAGQERTLRDHTYKLRMEKTAEILKRHLEYQRNPLPPPNFAAISGNFKSLEAEPENLSLLEGWKEKSVADAQRSLVQHELLQMFKGEIPIPFKTAAILLSPVTRIGSSVLEIGCSSGYYYEALEYLLNKKLKYTGVDFSENMIQMAKQYYPAANFKTADGAHLPFPEHSFDIVISGCVLIHCPNYKDHIKETCRAAKNIILLHRTPISHTGKTRFFEKNAYGVPTIEVWFGEEELLNLFAEQGFVTIDWLEYERDEAFQFSGVSYLLKRV